MGDNSEKSELIPHVITSHKVSNESLRASVDGLASYQVVGGVTAYQAIDR